MQVERMNRGEWGKILAFVDIKTDEGFILKGFKLIDGEKGRFVGFPSQKGQDDEYYPTIHGDTDLKDKVNRVVKDYYDGDGSVPPSQDEDEEEMPF